MMLPAQLWLVFMCTTREWEHEATSFQVGAPISSAVADSGTSGLVGVLIAPCTPYHPCYSPLRLPAG